MSDFWEVLGIVPTTDKSVIKRAYAALAKKYHPEQYPEEFLNLRNAYESAMDYASSESGGFIVRSELPNAISLPQKTKKTNAEEIYQAEQAEGINEEEQEISESGYWDLSKLSEQSEVDCAEAFAQFLDLYKSRKRNDAKQWYIYFTSPSFLEVWREESFTTMMWNAVLENMEEYPINKTFAKCLNAVYGCFVYAPQSFMEIQYNNHVLFDGFANIEKILELSGNIGKMTQNDLAMFISFCEYRLLVSFAEENQWSDTIKMQAEYIFQRYVMSYIKERCTQKSYSDVERCYLGIRLITNYIRKYELPEDIYQYIWKIYSLESAVNGRSKLYYGDIREIVSHKSKTPTENHKKIFDLYYVYQRNLAENKLEMHMIDDIFSLPETEKMLKDRHFIYDTLFYWMAMPHHIAFLERLHDFYTQNENVFKSKEILASIERRVKEVQAENALKEDEADQNYSLCTINHRPFLRYWLNIGFYRAINFANVLKRNLIFSEEWARCFAEQKHRLLLLQYKNKAVQIKFHRRYAEYVYGGRVIYKPFLQWHALENIEDDTVFFLLLPAVIPFVDDEKTYDVVLACIKKHLKNTMLAEENITQLSEGIIKMLFCGRFLGEEIDDEEAVDDYDCNASEIYRESETELYVCRWSKYRHALCFYEQKPYYRDFMPNGIYENILTETDAISLARELLTAQCAKTVADISYLRIMPEYMSIQPYGAKAEIRAGEKITEDAILDALDRFSQGGIRRMELKWLQEEVVLINADDKCACFWFHDKKYTTCKLLYNAEVYCTVDSKYVTYSPFLLGKLADYEIFRSPRFLVMKLCSLLFQFGEGNLIETKVNGMFVWSQSVYLYGKYDAYLVDKMKFGDYPPERIITDFNKRRKFIIPKFPAYMEAARENGEKQKTVLKPTTKDQLQMTLQMYLQGSIKYLHLCWDMKEEDNLFQTHLFLLHEKGKYALYYLNDQKMAAYCLIGSLDEYLTPEGQSPILELCGVPIHLYSIHHDIIRIRFFLSLLLDSIENPEQILNKVGEFTDGTRIYKQFMTYDELYQKLMGIG